MAVITYPYWDLSQTMLTKGTLCRIVWFQAIAKSNSEYITNNISNMINSMEYFIYLKQSTKSSNLIYSFQSIHALTTNRVFTMNKLLNKSNYSNVFCCTKVLCNSSKRYIFSKKILVFWLIIHDVCSQGPNSQSIVSGNDLTILKNDGFTQDCFVNSSG